MHQQNKFGMMFVYLLNVFETDFGFTFIKFSKTKYYLYIALDFFQCAVLELSPKINNKI